MTDEWSFDKTQNGHISVQQASERSQSIRSSELDEAIIPWFHVCRTKKTRELEQLLTKWRERETAMVITDGGFSPEPKLREQLVYLPPLSAATHMSSY